MQVAQMSGMQSNQYLRTRLFSSIEPHSLCFLRQLSRSVPGVVHWLTNPPDSTSNTGLLHQLLNLLGDEKLI